VLLPLVTSAVYLIIRRQPRELLRLISPVGVLILVAIIGPWYLALVGRLGLDTVLGMAQHEIGSRVGAERTAAGLLFFVPVAIAYYLPWTAYLAERPLERLRKTTRADVGGVLRSYPFIWFATYFLFYTFVVAENHQWYALQWAVPWIILLAGLVDLEESKLRSQSILWWFVIGAAGFAMLCVVLFWGLGPVLGSPMAVAVCVGASVAAAVLVAALMRMRAEPLHRVVAVAVLAMLGHTLVFQLLLPTTQLRPATTFARHLEQQTTPYRLLIGDRYLDKKLARYELPNLEEKVFEPDEAAFRVAWADTRPMFVLCREQQLDDMPDSPGYDIVAEGFARQKTRDESDVQWKQFLSERDPHLIFDRLVLLRRDDGP
jgi:4-amino-4-deoxy-L-arabinose transferase-like glycosyltransferase